MKVTETLRTQLINAAQIDLADKRVAYNKALTVLSEAEAILAWAKSLTTGSEFTTPEQKKLQIVGKYFLPSRSGGTRGHYVIKYADGAVDCSCPGFVNNHKCWASNKVKDSTYGLTQYIGTDYDWDSYRKKAFNFAYNR